MARMDDEVAALRRMAYGLGLDSAPRTPILRWVGALLQVVGVFALSTRAIHPAVAFLIMLVGALALLIEAARKRDWSLATMNAAFSVSNAIGVVQWWG